ncbi:amino acid adenylation domain-containing protein [Tumebacillus sp. BK434]|uniref:non-ribosomal peptide synthetase n=1 Tax=Tumebacillus sp. BK434 TaxID=2512169 RepID=UPI001048BAEA|nr:non-ribosomal peptide synthetase [Tumebacillus sp. BK434]TCP53869.1 amino acid adenylation domain-containing protein [Tumebacillus sp. BK434]
MLVQNATKERVSEIPLLTLPVDRPRPATAVFQEAEVRFALPGLFSQALTVASAREGVTASALLLASFQTLLARYSGQDELPIGLVDAAGKARLLYGELSFEQSFAALLKSVQTDVEQAQSAAVVADAADLQVLAALDGVLPEAKGYDLALISRQEAEGLVLILSYNAELFAQETIERMGGHFQVLLQAALTDSQQPIGVLPLITEAEREQLLRTWTSGPAVPLAHDVIHKLFEKQVELTPTRTALRFEGTSVTYAELNARANQLARALRSQGVQPEQLIGLCVDRSVELLVGILGILKAGAAYLPLDPSYPAERLAYMVEDAGVQLLLTMEHLQDAVTVPVERKICFDRDWPEIAKESTDNPDYEVEPDNLAYVIYTSGSTGKPKGVMIENSSVCNMSAALAERFFLDDKSVMLQFAAFSFDASVAEIFPALMHGSTVLLAPKDKIMPGPGLVELLNGEQVSHVALPPSVLALLPEDQLPHLQVVVSVGEACTAELVRKWSASTRTFVNGYGPTEGTVGALIGVCQPEEAVTVGRPLINGIVYLLDQNMQPVPVGVPGEICIGGAGLARGYLGRPELTQEKFVANPFADGIAPRLYKTGDLGCYLPDGRVKYIARIDHQVKIRGFRIELGEVESALLAHPDVLSATVIDREDTPGVKRLAGYVVPKDGAAISVRDLRSYLAARLPDFMVPTAFAMLPELPLTPNGKIDRRALPVPDAADRALHDEAYVAPRNEEEAALAAIYRDVLGVEQVGVHDHFFELGGESLLATKVVARVRELFGVEMPLNTLFAKPTVAELVEELAELRSAPVETLTPLTKRPRRERMPLSYAQERIWFLRELFPDNLSYSASCLLTFKGEFDVAVLERTLNEILRRHEIFRTTFQAYDGEPAQVVMPYEPVKLRVLDLHELPEAEKKAQMDAVVDVEIKKMFKLDELPMVRWTLFKLEKDVHTLLHVEDHLVHDGFSFSVFLYDFVHIYNAYLTGDASPLPEPEIQFVDFADWQREMMEGPEGDRQLAYWKEKLAGAPEILELPLDHPRPAVQRFKGAAFRFQIPYEVCQGVREFSRKNGVSLFMTLMAAYNVLLYRYSGQEDILVGTGIANRRLKETERLIGMIVNNVLLRTQLGGNPTFKAIVEQVRQASMESYDHQDVPFDKVIGALGIERDLNRNPLMQVMFSMHDTPMPELEIPGVEMFIHEGLNNGSAKFDMNIMVIPRHSKRLGVRGKGELKDEGITVNWEYNSDLWEADTIDHMIQNWINLLRGVIAEPEARIGDLPLLSQQEERKLLSDWNDTAADYPAELCLHQLFEEQVQKTPDNTAVIFGERTLTYAELDRQANQLAHHLRALGVGPDVPVGVTVERSVEMVTALLAVLKAGGAYLPLDTDAPPARKAQVLEDAQAPVCLSQSSLTDKLPQGAVRYVFVDGDAAEIAKHPVTKPDVDVQPEHLVSIYYTSGSTGKPKGVCSTHFGWVNRMNWMQRRYSLQASETLLQKTTLTFDDAAVEFFWPLMVGARIAMLEPELHKDPLAIMDAAVRYETAVLQFVPSMLSLFLDAVTEEKRAQLNALRVVISSGEALRADLVRSFLHSLPQAGLFNQWGATEVSIDSTCHEVTEADAHEEGIVSVGRPIDNNQVYILDGQLKPVPVGVPGDLYLAGIGLARGYLNNPERTAEAFLPHPFAPGEVVYKTGDRGYYRADGSIMFLGRRDDQVKVRGQRVELAEIEAVMVTHPAVKECAVVAHKRPNGYYVVGYYESEPGLTASTEGLREHMLALLPEYMVPARFVAMDALPTTVSGKLDRKLLPDPGEDRPDLEGALILPRTETERTIANIWQEILRLKEVGVYDKFFDLGGHSLDATRIMSRVNRELGTALPLRALFETLTVAGLAKRVDEVRNSGAQGRLKPVKKAPKRDRYELSNAQQRFWFDYVMHPESAYGPLMVSELHGALNVEAFLQAYAQLVQRHTIMRTTFLEAEGVPYQVVRDDLDVPCSFEDLSMLSEAEQQAKLAEHLGRVYRTPFDLINGPLFYSALIKLTGTKALWVRSTHAIVYDGWSSNVYMNDFAALYRAAVEGIDPELPDALQYVDYAAWQTLSLADGDMNEQKAYWLQRLAGAGSPPQLPHDFAPDEVERPEPMLTRHTTVEPELTANVRKLAQKQGTTTFLAVVAAFNIWLSRVSGTTDVVVGSPLTGRTNPELEPVIGVLVNPAALRTDLSGNPSAEQVMERTKTIALEAYANQDYPYDLLVQDLRPHRPESDPLYSIVLVGQNVHTGGFKLHDLTAEQFAYEELLRDQMSLNEERYPFDLHVEVFEKGDHLWVRTNYNNARFTVDTIDRLLNQFLYVLEQFVTEPEKRLEQFELERLEDTLDDLF